MPAPGGGAQAGGGDAVVPTAAPPQAAWAAAADKRCAVPLCSRLQLPRGSDAVIPDSTHSRVRLANVSCVKGCWLQTTHQPAVGRSSCTAQREELGLDVPLTTSGRSPSPACRSELAGVQAGQERERQSWGGHPPQAGGGAGASPNGRDTYSRCWGSKHHSIRHGRRGGAQAVPVAQGRRIGVVSTAPGSSPFALFRSRPWEGTLVMGEAWHRGGTRASQKTCCRWDVVVCRPSVDRLSSAQELWRSA